MELVLSLFASVVMAAEGILSPLADEPVKTTYVQHVSTPTTSFGSLLNPTASPTPTPTARPTLKPTVLGSQTQKTTPSPTPLQATYKARKNSYTIAFLGDSMIDTLGPDIPHLKRRLESQYPGTKFTLHNHGVGATNIDAGLSRITGSYTYLGQEKASIVSQHPDIVVVESFGYNPYPFDTGALDKHWLQLATTVDSIRTHIPTAKIIIAATIAPSSLLFGDGAPGLAFSAEDKRARTKTIKEYLESTIKFAQSQHLPLADVYHASLTSNGDGNATYINGGDHIHYSDPGRELFAKKVAETINSHKLLE